MIDRTTKLLIRMLAVQLVLQAAIVAACACASAAEPDYFDAAVRVRCGNGIGSGMVFAIYNGWAWVLTNAHVADAGVGGTAHVEFWRNGVQSDPVSGTIAWGSLIETQSRDMAVVAVSLDRLGGIAPHVVPLAPPEASPPPGAIVRSIGCPRAEWPNSWKGRVLGRDSHVIYFEPAPIGGRSGSALLNEDGTAIVGLIAWRGGEDAGAEGLNRGIAHGVAMDCADIWDAGQGRPPRGMRAATIVDAYPLLAAHWKPPNLFCAQWDQGGQWCPPGYGRSPYGQQPYSNQQPYGQYGGQYRGNPWPINPEQAPGNPPAAQPNYATKDDLTKSQQEQDQRLAAELGKLRDDFGQRLGAVEQLGATLQHSIDHMSRSYADELTRSTKRIEELNRSTLTRVDEVERTTAERDGELQQRIEELPTVDLVHRAIADSAKRILESRGAATAGTAATAGGLLGVPLTGLLVTALGITGPLAIAIPIGAWLVSRRLKPRVERVIERVGGGGADAAPPFGERK